MEPSAGECRHAPARAQVGSMSDMAGAATTAFGSVPLSDISPTGVGGHDPFGFMSPTSSWPRRPSIPENSIPSTSENLDMLGGLLPFRLLALVRLVFVVIALDSSSRARLAFLQSPSSSPCLAIAALACFLILVLAVSLALPASRPRLDSTLIHSSPSPRLALPLVWPSPSPSPSPFSPCPLPRPRLALVLCSRLLPRPRLALVLPLVSLAFVALPPSSHRPRPRLVLVLAFLLALVRSSPSSSRPRILPRHSRLALALVLALPSLLSPPSLSSPCPCPAHRLALDFSLALASVALLSVSSSHHPRARLAPVLAFASFLVLALPSSPPPTSSRPRVHVLLVVALARYSRRPQPRVPPRPPLALLAGALVPPIVERLSRGLRGGA